MILDGIDFDSEKVREALKDPNSKLYQQVVQNAKNPNTELSKYLYNKALDNAKKNDAQRLLKSQNIQQRAKILKELVKVSPGTTLEQLAEKYKDIKDTKILKEEIEKQVKYSKNKANAKYYKENKAAWENNSKPSKPIEINWKSLGKGLIRGGIEAAIPLAVGWYTDKDLKDELKNSYIKSEFSENDLNLPKTSAEAIGASLAMQELMDDPDAYQEAILAKEEQEKIQAEEAELARQELVRKAILEAKQGAEEKGDFKTAEAMQRYYDEGLKNPDFYRTFDLAKQLMQDKRYEDWSRNERGSVGGDRPIYTYSPFEMENNNLIKQYEAQDAADYREKVKKRTLEKVNKYRKKHIEESKTNRYDGYIGYSDLI